MCHPDTPISIIFHPVNAKFYGKVSRGDFALNTSNREHASSEVWFPVVTGDANAALNFTCFRPQTRENPIDRKQKFNCLAWHTKSFARWETETCSTLKSPRTPARVWPPHLTMYASQSISRNDDGASTAKVYALRQVLYHASMLARAL